MISIPLDQIRPHVFAMIFMNGMEGGMWRLMIIIEGESAFYGHGIILGELNDGELTRGASRHSEIDAQVKVVAKEFDLPIDGAIVGVGAKSLPAATEAQSDATPITWRIGQPSSAVFSEKRGGWGINMEKVVGDRYPAALLLYSADRDQWG